MDSNIIALLYNLYFLYIFQIFQGPLHKYRYQYVHLFISRHYNKNQNMAQRYLKIGFACKELFHKNAYFSFFITSNLVGRVKKRPIQIGKVFINDTYHASTTLITICFIFFSPVV